MFKMTKQFTAMLFASILAVLAFPAAAQAAGDPIGTILASVDLTTVASAIAAIALIVVAIALTFKGPDVAKRVIKKV